MSDNQSSKHIRQPSKSSDQTTIVEGNGMSGIRSRLIGGRFLTTKDHFIAFVAEFVGTFMFLFFALGGTNAVNTASDEPILATNPAKLLYICLCFGISLLVNVWVFYRVSGGLFNPAVTIVLVIVGAINLVRGIIVFFAQLLGAIAASAVLFGLLPGPLIVGTKLRPDVSLVQGLFIEMFLTALLVLTILMLAVEKHRATFTAPIGIGLALFTAELVGVPYTGGSLNPARSFGPCVVNGFESYHWVYWIGPILGALVAAGFYKFIKFMGYETVNPGQDHSGLSLQDDTIACASHEHSQKRLDLEARGAL